MRAELAGIYHCAVPFLSRTAANLCGYYCTRVTLFLELGSAPLRIRKAHISTCPSLAACCNGVYPTCQEETRYYITTSSVPSTLYQAYSVLSILVYTILPKTKKFGCVGRGDLTLLFFSKVMK